MSKTFVVPDIHGRLDLLELALDRIKTYGSGKVIFTGDYIDRGPQSKEVVDLLMEGPPDNFSWEFVRGNHEDMILECHTGQNIEWWIQNGGGETLESYGWKVPEDHIKWFEKLPRLLWDEHRVYVHAGVSSSFPLKSQPEQLTQWYRYPSKASVGHKEDGKLRHVVHGHTPSPNGPELYSNRTNLDTGAFFSNLFVVGVFDDDTPGGPEEILKFRQEV